MKKEKTEKILGIAKLVCDIILFICAIGLFICGEKVYGTVLLCFLMLSTVADHLLNIKKSVDLLHCMVMVLLIEKYEGYEIKVTRKDKSVDIVKKNQTIKSE